MPFLLLLILPFQGQPQDLQDVTFEDVMGWEEKGLEILYFSGSVRIQMADGELSADRVVAWRRAKGPRPPGFDELYAEGNVIWKRKDSLIQTEGLFIDRKVDQAFFYEFVLRGYSRGFGSPMVFRAREARRLSSDRYVLEQVQASTCVYGTPHYAVRIGRAEVTIDSPPQEGPAPSGWEPFPTGADIYLDASDISLWYGGLPVFYFPGVSLRLGEDLFIRRLQIGSSSRFSTYVLTEWGISFEAGRGKERKKWGDLLFQVDWRKRRGYGLGVDFEWDTEFAKGYIDTYGLHDLGPNPRNSFDAMFLPLLDEDRWRMRTFHRHDVSPTVRYEVEFSYLSDRNLLEEWFRSEFRVGKEQESTFYVRGRDGPNGWFAQYRARVNDFQTQTEYLPRAELWTLPQPVIPGVVFGTTNQVANLRARFDEALGTPSFRALRFDLLHEASIPFRIGPLRVLPFVAWRINGWDNDLAGVSRSDVLLLGGLGLRLAMSRVYDVHSFGMNGLRHVILLDVRYVNAFRNDLDRSVLFRFDNVDRLGRYDEIAVRISQHFETKLATVSGGTRIHRFLMIDLAAEYYPHSHRDTLDLSETGFVYPFDPMGIFPLSGEPFERRKWSNVFWDFFFDPAGSFSLRWDGEIDPRNGREITRRVGIAFKLAGVSLAVNNTFVRGGTDTIDYRVRVDLTKKWSVWARSRYDRVTHEPISRTAILTRNLHDLLLNIEVERNEIEDDYSVSFRVEPIIFNQRPERSR